MATLSPPEHAHQLPLESLLQAVQVNPASGLTAAEARSRYDTYGPNALEETKR